jgi:hypothetical protein
VTDPKLIDRLGAARGNGPPLGVTGLDQVEGALDRATLAELIEALATS